MAKLPDLAVVYDPKTCTPDLDVVFVHGIGGDLIKTWENRETRKMWPRELLPQKRPNTRVLSYGYNADAFNTTSHVRIRHHARTLVTRLLSHRVSNPNRALIFVGHCLGGLIVKQALNLASNEREKFESIMTATCGAFFFATPHKGSNEEQLAALARYFTPSPADESSRRPSGLRSWSSGLLRRTRPAQVPTSQLVKSIHTKARDHGEISEDFRNLTKWYNIVNWFECESLPESEILAVAEDSAKMWTTARENYPVAGADHFNLCHLDFEAVDKGTFGEFMTEVENAFRRGYRGPESIVRGDSHVVGRRGAETACITSSRSPDGRHRGMERATADSDTRPVRGEEAGGPTAIYVTAEVPSQIAERLLRAAFGSGVCQVNSDLTRLEGHSDTREVSQTLPWMDNTGAREPCRRGPALVVLPRSSD